MSVAHVGTVGSEMSKLLAFARRDFLVAWSYRVTFIGDALNLIAQVLVFAYVSRMVDPAVIPSFGGGSRAGYLEFVTIGIAFTGFLQLGLGRMVTAIRQEQLMGTLEALLMTPTSLSTLQLGWVAYDLVYVPIRTAAFLLLADLTFGLHIDPAGILIAGVLLLAFVPCVWGLGIISGALVLTFRRGSGALGLAAFGLSFTSGAYFPLELFPGWVAAAARWNPVTLALNGSRDALLGGAGLVHVTGDLAALTGFAALSLTAGAIAFRLALRRELRLGTLGTY